MMEMLIAVFWMAAKVIGVIVVVAVMCVAALVLWLALCAMADGGDAQETDDVDPLPAPARRKVAFKHGVCPGCGKGNVLLRADGQANERWHSRDACAKLAAFRAFPVTLPVTAEPTMVSDLLTGGTR